MPSIFDLETRIDFEEEYKKIRDLVEYEEMDYRYTEYYQDMTIMEIIDEHLFDWKHAKTEISMHEFFKKKKIDIQKSDDRDTVLYYFDFMYNIIPFLITENYISRQDKKAYKQINIIKGIIENTLEANNYKTVYSIDRYKIIKRDVDVDSVLEVVPDLSRELLSYLDFRVKNDLYRKQDILMNMIRYIESNESTYSSQNNNLLVQVNRTANTYHIRHEDDEQVDLPDNELLEVYDAHFKMMLHLIRTPEINRLKKKITDKRIEQLGR